MLTSLCGIEGLVKESHAHTNVVDAQNARCGIVWNLAARNAEFKLQIRHHGGVDTVLHVMEGRRLTSTATLTDDVQSKLGGDVEAGKGDDATEQKAQATVSR